MKPKKLLSLGLASVLVFSTFGGVTAKGKVNTKSTTSASTPAVNQIMDKMTVEEKVGQMLMPDFRNWQKKDDPKATGFTVMNDEVGSLIKKYHLGGVILFAENVTGTEQTTRLVDGLQKASDNIPLLITIDQEGGIVTRLQTGTNLPGNMALGATRSEKEAYNTGSIIGKELASLGINVNFAPSLDVNNNPDNPVIGVRSISSNPQLVSQLGIKIIKGLQDQNVATTAKHFPGHGDTAVDSHYGLPLVTHSKDRLREVELYPFKKAIEQNVDMIMTAHVQFPAFDDTKYISKLDGKEIMVPATLSKKILTDLLRTEMGFKGVSVTDALNMKAIADNFGEAEATIMAINAGVDIALMPTQVTSLEMEKNFKNVYDAVVDAVKNGRIPQSEIDDSVKRILELKVKRGIYQPGNTDTVSVEAKVSNALKVVGNPTHKQLEEKMANQAVTLLKNEKKTLPFKPKRGQKVLVLAPFQDQVDAVKKTIEELIQKKAIHPVQVNGLIFSNKTFDDVTKKAIDQADYIITGSYVVKNDPAVNDGVIDDTVQDSSKWATAFPRAAMKYTKEKKKKNVIISLRNPYDAANFSEADALLAVYGHKGYANGRYGQPNIRAGIKAVFGQFNTTGKLPVDVPKIGDSSSILYPYGYGLSLKSNNGKHKGHYKEKPKPHKK